MSASRAVLLVLALVPWLVGYIAGVLAKVALFLAAAVIEGYKAGRG